MESIIITEPNIISYYKENPNLDIVNINLIFIDILKNLSSNLSNTINNTINSKILDIVSDIDKNISTFKSDIIINFNDKLLQTKKDYIEDLKIQLTNNILSNNEKISCIIDKNTDTILTKTTSIVNDIISKNQDKNNIQLENCIKSSCSLIEQDTKKILETKNKDENTTKNIIDNIEKISSTIDKNTDTILTKTTSIINDIIPKSQDKNYLQIEGCIKTFCSLIEQDTKKLLEIKNKDESSTKIIIDNIDSNFSKMISNVQTPIFNLIQSSEQRTTSGIQKVNDEFTQQKIIQEKLSNELNDFLNKYKNNSSLKGAISENELYNMLLLIMPSDEIIKVSSETASCDFRVNRKDKKKPTILFENKDYNRSVSTDEVEKFKRDIQLQKCNGVFISQKTPISLKESFQIDIINGLIHIFIPNLNYDCEKLKVAIDIIDNLSSKLHVINNDGNNDYSLNKKEIEEISDEYRNFALQKLLIIDNVKIMSKQILDKIEDMQFPKIKSILVNCGIVENENLNCSYCNYQAKNKASLSAHSRSCKSNPSNPNIKNKKDDALLYGVKEKIILEDITIENETNKEFLKKNIKKSEKTGNINIKK
jgi:hypothetical protein